MELKFSVYFKKSFCGRISSYLHEDTDSASKTSVFSENFTFLLFTKTLKPYFEQLHLDLLENY